MNGTSMAFLAPAPLDEVARLAAVSPGYVAVPYIGKGAAKLVPLREGSVLVTRLDEQAVRAGTVDPAEILKFMRRAVDVHRCSNLHAKVKLLSSAGGP